VLVIERSPNLRTAGVLSVGENERCFRECGGNVEEAAKKLEVSRWALARRLKERGLVRRARAGARLAISCGSARRATL
jgi:two-component system, NtrC family, nitrogen regulation response regulator GlnG